jgi:hypothetical protein
MFFLNRLKSEFFGDPKERLPNDYFTVECNHLLTGLRLGPDSSLR